MDPLRRPPPVIAEFHVKYKISLNIGRKYLHPWRIYNNRGDVADVHYEHQKDAWEFAKTLARKTKGKAILYNMDGSEKCRVNYAPTLGQSKSRG